MLKQIKELLYNYKLTFSKDFNSAYCDFFHIYYIKDEFENEYVEVHLTYPKKSFYLELKHLPILCKILCEKKMEF